MRKTFLVLLPACFAALPLCAQNTDIYFTDQGSKLVVGSGGTLEIQEGSTFTGDGEVALSENSIGPDEAALMVEQVIFCGDNANDGTIYGGPNTTLLGGDYSASSALNSAACQALDSATEATADAALFANTAFKVDGMFCKVDSSGSNGVTFTLRSAEADTTPAISCTIATSETTCTSTTGSTTDIAAGATVAVKSVTTEDLSTNDFWCKVFITLK